MILGIVLTTLALGYGVAIIAWVRAACGRHAPSPLYKEV